MTDSLEPELPHGIALAWGIAANPQRGPKREMSVERIVEAAIDLADEGGLGAVSMSAVAAQLGFTPMSLYRYVSAKDDLVLLMVEQAQGVPPETIAEAQGWREALAVFAAESLAGFAQHPWILDVPVVGISYTPNSLAWLDSAIAALRDTPLDHAECVAAALAVIAQVRFEGIVSRGYAAAAEAVGTRPEDLDAAVAGWLPHLVTPEQFPEVHAALMAGAFAPDAPSPFGFGLDRVLDGIDAYIAARQPGPARPGAVPDPIAELILRDPKVREAARSRREAERALRDARKREREAQRAAREKAARG